LNDKTGRGNNGKTVFFRNFEKGVKGGTMEEKIKQAIEKIRPILQQDGGDIEFVALKDKVVQVRLKGACSGCPMSQVTLKSVVEQTLKKEVPEIEKVETV